MRRAVVLFVLATLMIHAPWRLGTLAVETLFVSPGGTRFDQRNDKYWDAMNLEARLEDMGWSVGYRRGLNFQGQAAYGLTDTAAHTIAIDATLSWNARYAVLAHEGGHTLQRGWYTRLEGEAFAESVAALVSHDGLREHARYLSAFRADALWIMVTDSRAIYRAARTLEDQ